MQTLILQIIPKILRFNHIRHFGKVLNQNYLAHIKFGHLFYVHFYIL